MQYIAYYLIRPSKLFCEKLKQLDSDIAELLSEPILWSKKEGGRTVWNESDFITQVKLAFLINLLSTYRGGEIETLINSLLGKPPFRSDVFDKWWEIERFSGIDDSFEDIEMQMNREDIHELETNSPLVETRLSSLKKQREESRQKPELSSIQN
jgi:hypothetical protein